MFVSSSECCSPQKASPIKILALAITYGLEPPLLRLDLSISLDRVVVVGGQAVHLIPWELDTTETKLVIKDPLFWNKVNIVRDALDQLRFVRNLSTLVNGFLLCTRSPLLAQVA
jgi:hypothetical protein